MQKSNVYLVGLMGSGKTSIGKILAKRMGMKFIDLDAEIIKDQQCSISVSYTHLTLPTKRIV